jgi:endothelin-converting enzyme/putative endopeptidase
MFSLITVLLAISFVPSIAQQGIEVGDMNRSVDPCNDFYEYANGTWRAQNPIPPSMQRWSRRWAAGELAKDQLHDVLEDVSKKTDWPKSSVEQQIGDYYASCMNEDKINREGAKTIKGALDGIDSLRNISEVENIVGKGHRFGIASLFILVASPDNHDPNQIVADIGASGIGLPDRDYYLKAEPRFKEAREKYRAHITAMFKLVGYNAAAAKKASDTVFDIESKLAEVSLDNVALREPQNTDHKMLFADLQKLTPHFDWAAYFRGILPQNDLNVSEPKFLQEVDTLLQTVPLDAWKTYLKWNLINTAAPSLSQPFVEENFNFYGNYLNGQKELKPRWKRCVEAADEDLGEALGQKYVEKYFPPEAKARMQELVKNLLLAMQDTINNLDWMGPETKKKALEKLSTFNPKIGYPDKWKDYSKVEIYRDVPYWENVMSGQKFKIAESRATIGQPADRGRWGMTPPTSDAYYNPLWNEIVFPAGILQPPAFSMKVVDAVNYGAIGVVIGHEISHGFDDQGAQFDAQGRLQNWWSDEDLKRFTARGQCVVDQFENYFIEPGIHHNGKLVLGESIGDLAGAKIAFLAFKKSLEGKPPAPVIDGFTPEQQFFIAWGQFRGDAMRPEFQRLMVQSDPHPISKFRVIGPVSNSLDFRKAFACKADAPMVRPEGKRCEVW